MSQSWAEVPIETKRSWHNIANTRLVGDTISLSEDDWHAPSLLPGWSRAHVATHLARSADEIISVLRDPASGWGQENPDKRFRDLEIGADRPSLSIQEDLDSALGLLADAADKVVDWNRPIRINAGIHPLSTLTLLWLHEVLIHHLDLSVGFSPDQISDEAGKWLLEFVVNRLREDSGPVVQITSESGLQAVIGRGEPRHFVSGTNIRLWAWLCGRVGADWVEGAEGLELGLLA
ncbi:MAG: maleylpyruvate isomerase family mycothiol-dependent enzyme [Propionibacteriaceae bacterium]|nr:maleylpyruvate isomerase family mycothiol-dependent enzyme [Propionibacteriaceae bacterium]